MKDFQIQDGVLVKYTGPGGNVTVPAGVTAIGSFAFSHCVNLTAITLPEGVSEIGEYAFLNCRNLTAVSLPATLLTIGNCAFSGCETRKILCAAVVPNCSAAVFGVVWRHPQAIFGTPKLYPFQWVTDETGTLWLCRGRKRHVFGVNLEKKLTALFSSGKASDLPCEEEPAPQEAPAQEPAPVSPPEPSAVLPPEPVKILPVPDEDDFLIPAIPFQIENGVLIKYSGNDSRVVVPETVRELGPKAFAENSTMQSIALPSSLRFVGDECFRYCTALEEIRIPEGVETIPYGAFRGCRALKSIALPDTLKKIEYWAFIGCLSLTEIPRPESLQSWASNLFGSEYIIREVTHADGTKWLCQEQEQKKSYGYWDMHPYPLDPELRSRMGYGSGTGD